jgi:hypothetical protein
MQTVVNPTIANSECFLKMHKADFVQKFVVKLARELVEKLIKTPL